MSEGKSYLTTTLDTQMSFTGRWCAGHPWRNRNHAFGWIHHIGHRVRLLHNQAPRYLMVYIDGKPESEQ